MPRLELEFSDGEIVAIDVDDAAYARIVAHAERRGVSLAHVVHEAIAVALADEAADDGPEAPA